MKKIGLILGGFFLVVIGALILIPILFKGDIESKVKEVINKNVNATVQFQDVELSMFRSFPQLSVGIQNLVVVGKEDFANDTLMSVEMIELSTNLSALWDQGSVELTEINIVSPDVRLLSNKEGKVNWDIAPTSSEPSSEETSEQSATPLKVQINRFRIQGAKLLYKDEAADMLYQMDPSDLLLSGKMEGEESKLKLEFASEGMTFSMEGSEYLNKVPVSFETGLNANFSTMVFTLLENKLLIQQLPLEMHGSLGMLEDGYDLNLDFESPESSFETILKLIPAEYQSYLEGISTKGELSFNGSVKGVYKEEDYPAIDLNLAVKNGYVKYQDLPESVENISVVASISKPQGDLDQLIVDVPSLSASVASFPVQGSLKVATPMSDPMLSMNAKGKIDFEKLKGAIPMDSIDLKGRMEADLSLSGRYSAIEKEQYDKFSANGTATLTDFEMVSPDFEFPIQVPSASLSLTSKEIAMKQMKVKMGDSDFALVGSIQNYIPYAMKDQTLRGTFTMNSSYINLNQLMSGEEETVEQPASEGTVQDTLTVQIPSNLNLVFNASIDKIRYESMDITNSKGQIVVKDQKAILNDLSMNMLNGQMVMRGDFDTKQKDKPSFDFDVDVKSLDVPTAYSSMSSIQRYAPVVGEGKGSFSSDLKLSGTLDHTLSPVYTTLNGEGGISTKDLMLVGSDVFQEIGKYFKKGTFDQIAIDDFLANFTIENGGINVTPFTTQFSGQQATIQGVQSVDGTMDYSIDLLVNKDDMTTEVTKYMDVIPGVGSISKFDITINVTGPMSKPVVKLDLTKAKKQVEAEFKKQGQKELEKATKKIGSELKKLFK